MFRAAAEIIGIVLFIGFLIWITIAFVKGVVNMYYGKNIDNSQEIEDLKNRLLEKDNQINLLKDELEILRNKSGIKSSIKRTTRKAE